MEAIADEIGGASTELVERVLERYGDPAGDEPAGVDEPDGVGEHASEAIEDEVRARSDRSDRGDRGDRNGESGRDDRNGTDELSEPGATGSSDVRDVEEVDPDGSGSSTSTRAASGPDSDSDAMANGDGRDGGPDADLTEGQLRALRLVAADPEASQREIAEEFDVTRATISRWLNDIEGFEWARRREDAALILNGDGGEGSVDRAEPGIEASGAGSVPATVSGTPPAENERSGELGRRLDAVEQRLDGLEAGAATRAEPGREPETRAEPEREPETGAGSAASGIDPELAHRVVHACMNSDRITEEEELRLLRTLMA